MLPQFLLLLYWLSGPVQTLGSCGTSFFLIFIFVVDVALLLKLLVVRGARNKEPPCGC